MNSLGCLPGGTPRTQNSGTEKADDLSGISASTTRRHRSLAILIRIVTLAASWAIATSHAAEPGPVAVPFSLETPTSRQLEWQAMEFYGLLHIGPNTVLNLEWSYGDFEANRFNPTKFDARALVTLFQDSGMKGLVLVCKHHDGFCLWPSRYTDFSVKKSAWRDGTGDMVRELAEAARDAGLKFGVYLSPWDRNNKDYGRAEYLLYYRDQLKELLSNYGEIFIAWFDGAKGGEGFYGGAGGVRQIDNRTYYDWPNTWRIVRDLQPNAVIFSDAGPDVRWIGNEQGRGSDPCWYTMNLGECYPGMANYQILGPGMRHGTNYVPPECDVSIRPGWFYHPSEDSKVKTTDELIQIYCRSVGLGACLNLNVPPDKDGVIHEQDAASLRGLGKWLSETFATNLALHARASASNTREGAARFSAANLSDDHRETYWSVDDSVKNAEAILDLGKPTQFNILRIREFLPLGQRVEGFALDAEQNGRWREIAHGRTIGNQRLVRLNPFAAQRIRLRITEFRAPPAISEFSLFLEPQYRQP